ncbi:MAG: hypothetical protein GC136_02380 [Alphaproteobacteria bacterium]|nr:hypothetical protein [Alphaproteobacteria bacterium]
MSYIFEAYKQAGERGCEIYQIAPEERTWWQYIFLGWAGEATHLGIDTKTSLYREFGQLNDASKKQIDKLRGVAHKLVNTGLVVNVPHDALDAETYETAARAFYAATKQKTRTNESLGAVENFNARFEVGTVAKENDTRVRKRGGGTHRKAAKQPKPPRYSANGKRLGRPPGSGKRVKDAPAPAVQ